MFYSKKRIVNLDIPDNDKNGLRDIIYVEKDLNIKDVRLSINITHPYNGDISLEITSPKGTKANILSPGRSPGEDIRSTFEGDSLSKFEGEKSKGEWILKVIDSGARDNGSLDDWCLGFSLEKSKRSEIFIEDDLELNSSQFCQQGGPIKEITAKVNVEHGHIGDLILELSAPSGKSITIHNKVGGGNKSLVKSFADELNSFIGESAKGKWTMKISDTMPRDAGHLVSWGLKIVTGVAPPKREDLTTIEGIGPKIKDLLYDGGIYSFEQLANSTFGKLKKILSNAGPRYQMHDPTSWPKQSRLAADGKWDALETLQDELDGGK